MIDVLDFYPANHVEFDHRMVIEQYEKIPMVRINEIVSELKPIIPQELAYGKYIKMIHLLHDNRRKYPIPVSGIFENYDPNMGQIYLRFGTEDVSKIPWKSDDCYEFNASLWMRLINLIEKSQNLR